MVKCRIVKVEDPTTIPLWSMKTGEEPGKTTHNATGIHLECDPLGKAYSIVDLPALREPGKKYGCYLYWLESDPIKMGVGGAALSKIEGFMKKKGCSVIDLFSDWSAEDFWVAQGYKRRWEDTDDEYYTKRLETP